MTPPAMVVVPTYDEIENVETLIEAILAQPGGFHALIVDDGSPDGTGEEAERLARDEPRIEVLHRTTKEGIGPAYLAGFRHALSAGARFILQMDADLSHDPADLPRLLTAVRHDCDLCLGSRYYGGVRVLDWSVRRLTLSLGASLYVKRVLSLPVADPTGGFKCWRREVLEAIDLDAVRARGYCFQIEMTYRAIRRGFRVREIPIIFRERRRGGSKITKSIVYEALYLLWRLRLQSAFEDSFTTETGRDR